MRQQLRCDRSWQVAALPGLIGAQWWHKKMVCDCRSLCVDPAIAFCLQIPFDVAPLEGSTASEPASGPTPLVGGSEAGAGASSSVRGAKDDSPSSFKLTPSCTADALNSPTPRASGIVAASATGLEGGPTRDKPFHRRAPQQRQTTSTSWRSPGRSLARSTSVSAAVERSTGEGYADPPLAVVAAGWAESGRASPQRSDCDRGTTGSPAMRVTMPESAPLAAGRSESSVAVTIAPLPPFSADTVARSLAPSPQRAALPSPPAAGGVGDCYTHTYVEPGGSALSGPSDASSPLSSTSPDTPGVPRALAAPASGSGSSGSASGSHSEAAASRSPPAAATGGRPPPPERAIPVVQLRILVVEDVATSRRFLIKVLQRQLPRAIITEAEDGQEALDAYAAASSTDKPSVVLIDKEMPRMDGYAATRRLRAMGFRGPIIGITGDAGQAAVDEFVAQGAVDVVTKPVQMAALLDIIERELTLLAESPIAAGAEAGFAGSDVAVVDSPPSRGRSGAGASGSVGAAADPPGGT